MGVTFVRCELRAFCVNGVVAQLGHVVQLAHLSNKVFCVEMGGKTQGEGKAGDWRLEVNALMGIAGRTGAGGATRRCWDAVSEASLTGALHERVYIIANRRAQFLLRDCEIAAWHAWPAAGVGVTRIIPEEGRRLLARIFAHSARARGGNPGRSVRKGARCGGADGGARGGGVGPDTSKGLRDRYGVSW